MIYHPKRISNLKPYENRYKFIHITPTLFETNNINVSLKIFNEENKKKCTSKSDTTNKACIVQLKNNRYVAMKPLKNTFTQLNIILKSFSIMELKDYVLNLTN